MQKNLRTAISMETTGPPAREHNRVLLYQVPLARLFDLSAELNACTAGTARHWVALSHYALVTRDPSGRAA